MPPKSKKLKEVVKDERLQAIVLTDSFETRFMPLTSVKPRCLLPLANVPLLEYTLEFLAKAGVDEVYLMCCSHADQIQAYIESSKWSNTSAPFKIQAIMTLESRSVGDAMRDLDNRGLITGDFLLVSGDVVTDIDFSKVMEAHKARKAMDRDHIATMVLTQASALHRTRSHAEPASFLLDAKTNRCIYYKDIPPADGKKSSIDIDPELLEDVDEFVIRNDLIDCHVDICSPHVPAIFQENFDYQYLRRDFVKGILSSDILKKSIYAYITDEYAARVESWQTYDAISQDILAKWVYPICPDSNFTDTSYQYEGKHVYKEDNVVLAQSCKIGACTAIGANSAIGDGTYIQNSVIGRNCRIGSNITITNSYIWDNTIIEDDSSVDHAIVASGAKIGKSCKLDKGAVLGFGVVIANGQVVGRDVRISSRRVTAADDAFGSESGSDVSDSEESNGIDPDGDEYDVSVVGVSGVGFIYESDDSDDQDESKPVNSLMYQMGELALSDDSIISATHTAVRMKKRRTYSTNSIMTNGDEGEDDEDFDTEGIATVSRALEHNHDLDTAMLELNTLRMSMNVSYQDVRRVTVIALLDRVSHFITTGTLKAGDATVKVIKQWCALFDRQTFTDSERIDLLNEFTRQTSNRDSGQQIMFFVVKTLYDEDIVGESVINDWWEQADQDNTYMQTFIKWLAEADEEDDDATDDDDSSDDE